MIEFAEILRSLPSLWPLAWLTFGSIFLLFVSGKTQEGGRKLYVSTLLAWVSALAAFLSLPSGQSRQAFYTESWVVDSLSVGYSGALLILLLLVIPLFHVSWGDRWGRVPSSYALLLLSAAGGIVMASANHLFLFFLGLELLTLPLYILTSVGPTVERSAEAAFKYFLLGALASSVFVYGTALLWGATGTLTITEMGLSEGIHGGLWLLGLAMVLGGLAFKIGLVPFHMWVPDVYEGAPATLTAWMAGAVKLATIVFAFRLLDSLAPALPDTWSVLLEALAMASMVLGSLGALMQTSLKRMLAYSSIAHAGYVTIGLISTLYGHGAEAAPALLYYVSFYGIAALVAFSVASLQEKEGRSEVSDVAGLHSRSPTVAFIFAVALFSLAGLPPLSGFVAKFNVFTLAVADGNILLAIVGVVTSVISLGYYLSLIVVAYMREPMERSKVPMSALRLAAMMSATVATIAFGLFPSRVLNILFHDTSTFFR